MYLLPFLLKQILNRHTGVELSFCLRSACGCGLDVLQLREPRFPAPDCNLQWKCPIFFPDSKGQVIKTLCITVCPLYDTLSLALGLYCYLNL